MARKRLKVIILLFSIVWLGALIFNVRFGHENLFPKIFNDPGFRIKTSHEEIADGFSTTKLTIEKDKIVFDYQLSSKLAEPFAAVYIQKINPSGTFLSISRYNTLLLNIEAKKSKKIPIHILLNYKGFTADTLSHSEIPISYTLDYEGAGTYKLSLSQFKTPDWWFRMHGKHTADFSTPDFSRVSFIVINTCQQLKPGESDKMIIRSVDFTYSNTHVYWLWAITGCCGYLIIWLGYKYSIRKKVLVPFAITDVPENKRNELEEIVNYLALHYTNPAMLQTDLQKSLGISSRRIGELLKENHQTTFKIYLNTLRLAEGKRLLIETDYSISEIAFMVGYNNVTHFNRVFKSSEGINPREFRQKNFKDT